MKLECDYYKKQICKSCDLIETDQDLQIKLKEEILQSIINKECIEKSEYSLVSHFRDKAKVNIGGTVDSPIIGIINDHEQDIFSDLTLCPLHSRQIIEVLKSLPTFIKEYNLSPYSPKNRTGELKSVIIFISPKSQEGCIRFVLRSKEAKERLQKMTPKLQGLFPFLKVVTMNIQSTPHAILEGEEEILLSKESSFTHEINEFKFKVLPQSFLQTNTIVAEKLYQTAKEWTKLLPINSFTDLFCGYGPFSFHMSHLKNGQGYEVSTDAIKSANSLKEELKMHHLSFRVADLNKFHQLKPSQELIIANPPRAGLKNSIDIITKNLPQYFLYSSCNFETFKTDFEKLKQHYQISRAKIFDMFPHTKHFETLILMEKIQ